jgi:hypothetical protein
MDKLSDFISRIFSTDRTQGLSGGAEVVIDRDPASAFYASRLRKHRSEEDLVETPTWLWATVSYNGRKGGLRSHVVAERGEGIASFTDVLVVLNQADARRAAQVEGEPWTERAARAISEKFSSYCAKERFELLYGTRPLRFWFVADGGQDMLGHSFGLGPGEFITGLLPNLYVGPAPRSRPVLAVHLHLPGAWEGYREVGRLYSDQILFTLGRHWLDNFHHPKLREPGLYRLQQFPDGSLVHVISPELQDRYFVRSDALEGGASVLTIAERSGNPVAYLVLAVIETPAMAEPGMTVGVPLAALRSQGLVTDVEVKLEDEPGPPRVPTAPPAAAESAVRREMLQRTIIPDAVETRMLTLHERGALLQKVHFANFMDGYDVYVGSGGRVATQMASPRATLQVRGPRVSLAVVEDGVRVDGKVQKAGTTLPLSGTVELEIDGHALQYRDLTGIRVDGWPYLGELRRPGAGTYLDFGGVFRVGRDRRCQVRLPDEPHNDNITWLPQVGTGATIRSRTGDIPKSRFYTDSIMVASEHAELDLASDPTLRSLARHCYTYVRRDGDILALAPREAEGRHQIELRPNDEVLVGNCLFQVSYPPVAGQMGPMTQPPPPPARPSAGELASLVDLPEQPTDGERPAIDMPRAVTKPPRINDALSRSGPVPAPPATDSGGPLRIGAEGRVDPLSLPTDGGLRLPPRVEEPSKIRASTTYDPAVAAGLGEPGPAPRAPRLRNEPPAGMRQPATPAAAKHGAGPLADGPTTVDPVQPKRVKSATSLPDPGEAPPIAAQLGLAGSRKDTAPPDNSMFARSVLQPPPVLKAPARPTPPPPPMLIEDPLPVDRPHEEVDGAEPGDPILAVEEARWKLEMARPARLVQVGWMISSEVIVGNHATAQVVVPEVRAFPEQAFLTLDYFKIALRGRRGRIELLQEGEASLTVNGAAVSHTEDMENARLSIVRRDENLEPDFDIGLRVRRDEELPDPRAQLIEIDVSDRLVAALFTLGFPLRADRRVRLGRIEITLRYDGNSVRIMDYLNTYKVDHSFLPFYHRPAGRPWKTMPEDGAPVDLRPNDGLMIGNAVYTFQAS